VVMHKLCVDLRVSLNYTRLNHAVARCSRLLAAASGCSRRKLLGRAEHRSSLAWRRAGGLCM
jgi:hypothetical protein